MTTNTNNTTENDKEEAIEAEYTDKNKETEEESSPPALVAPRYLKPLTFDNESGSESSMSIEKTTALILALVVITALVGLYIYGGQVAGSGTTSTLTNFNLYT